MRSIVALQPREVGSRRFNLRAVRFRVARSARNFQHMHDRKLNIEPIPGRYSTGRAGQLMSTAIRDNIAATIIINRDGRAKDVHHPLHDQFRPWCGFSRQPDKIYHYDVRSVTVIPAIAGGVRTMR